MLSQRDWFFLGLLFQYALQAKEGEGAINTAQLHAVVHVFFVGKQAKRPKHENMYRSSRNWIWIAELHCSSWPCLLEHSTKLEDMQGLHRFIKALSKKCLCKHDVFNHCNTVPLATWNGLLLQKVLFSVISVYVIDCSCLTFLFWWVHVINIIILIVQHVFVILQLDRSFPLITVGEYQ